MKTKNNSTFALFFTFFKIGLFTFGGGYAMIPLIQKETVDNKKWISNDDILEIIAIAESTPGPIAINSATFVGYRVAGFWGALFSTLGVTLPSFVIIYLISFILRSFSEFKIVKYAFTGIRAGVLALIIKALYSMYKQCPKSLFYYIIAALAFICAAVFDVGVLFIIIACAVSGMVFSLIAKRKAEGRSDNK